MSELDLGRGDASECTLCTNPWKTGEDTESFREIMTTFHPSLNVLNTHQPAAMSFQRERILIRFMMSDHKLVASREGSK